MASITYDKTTNGKFRVRAIDNQGKDIEVFCDTQIDAQIIANNESNNQMRYFGEFEIIDKLNQHPSGLNFREWLKRNEKN